MYKITSTEHPSIRHRRKRRRLRRTRRRDMQTIDPCPSASAAQRSPSLFQSSSLEFRKSIMTMVDALSHFSVDEYCIIRTITGERFTQYLPATEKKHVGRPQQSRNSSVFHRTIKLTLLGLLFEALTLASAEALYSRLPNLSLSVQRSKPAKFTAPILDDSENETKQENLSEKIPKAARHVAFAMKSESFLRALCKRKNTFNAMFYATEATTSSAVPPSPGLSPQYLPTTSDGEATQESLTRELDSYACEYIGKLGWFGQGNGKGGIKFRETVNISHLHPCTDTSAVVLCTTEYYNGKRWVKCAVVTCHINSHGHSTSACKVDTNCSSIQMNTSSEILINVPMMPKPIRNALNSKIISTFEAAATEFVNQLYST